MDENLFPITSSIGIMIVIQVIGIPCFSNEWNARNDPSVVVHVSSRRQGSLPSSFRVISPRVLRF